MNTVATAIGLAAAICTTAANLPQLKKAWVTGQTDDLSLKRFRRSRQGWRFRISMAFSQTDFVIILANGISLLILKCDPVFEAVAANDPTPPTSSAKCWDFDRRPACRLRCPLLALSGH